VTEPRPRGVLVAFASAIERARIARYRARLRASGARAVMSFSVASLPAVIAGVLLALAALVVDRFAGSSNAADAPNVVPLLTAIAGFTGLLAVSVSASVGPVQAATGRMPTGVTAELVEDAGRDAVLRLVVATFVCAASLLLARLIFDAAVVLGVAVPTAVAALTLAALVGYISARLRLYRPAYLAERWANEMLRWLRGVASGPERGDGREAGR
jgi:hypothetical protein